MVKEVPYSQERIQIYEVVMRMHALESIVRLRGICKLVVKYGNASKKTAPEIGHKIA